MPDVPYRISLSVPRPDPDLPPTQHLGTVLYSGPVPPTSGTWLGVEWDESQRGKHSGEYAPTGVKYFACRVEGAGSFIRPTAKGLSTGRSFAAAIKDRYLDDSSASTPATAHPASLAQSDHSSPAQQQPHSTLYSTNFNREIEVPSLDRISALFKQLDRLTTAGLEYAEVASAGDDQDVAQLGQQMTRLRSVNLSFSLLPSLGEVNKIAVALPVLDTLQLNANRFRPITQPTVLSGFGQLTSLALNQTLVSWAEVVNLAPSLSKLRHLELGYNNITSLDSPAGLVTPSEGLTRLEELNLAGNQLTAWDHISTQLSTLPALSRLILSHNQIPAVTAPDATARTARLTRLRHLDLTDNLIAAWQSIDELNSLPQLKSLSVAGNPPLTGEEEERGGTSRLELIGRIGRIEKLEGSPVRPFERDDAERFYLATIARDTKLGTDAERAAAHPRYPELAAKHGAVTSPEPKPTMRSRLIQLHIELPPTLAPADGAAPTVAVLPTLRTMLLRPHLAKLVGRPVPKTKYKLVALLAPTPQADTISDTPLPPAGGEALEVEIPPAQEGRELGYWGLGDGDRVRVVEL